MNETTSESTENPNLNSTFWFIGLKFDKTMIGQVDLDLTEPIQDFTNKGDF